jgi:hypothetical protein
MIGISTLTFDLDGARVFRNTDREKDLSNRTGSRRTARTATLDGGVVIADMGYSDGDRDIIIEEPEASIEAVDYVRRIVELYNLVIVTTEDGAYEASPDSYGVSGGVLTMKMLVSQKISD